VIRLNDAIFFVGVDAIVRPLEKGDDILFCQLTVKNIYRYILDTPGKYLTILLLVLTAFLTSLLIFCMYQVPLSNNSILNVIVNVMHLLSATV
jgi:hypothetical protein